VKSVAPAAARAETGEPRFAYLVMTHKAPRQVEALQERIRALSPRAHVVVHHDARAPDVPWGGAPPPSVRLLERQPVLWGDWSMVEATLRLLRCGVDEADADWLVLLSGEHWPVVDLRAWELGTARGGADAIVDADRLPSRLRFGHSDPEANQYLARSLHRWTYFPRPRGGLPHRALGGLMKLSRALHPLYQMEYAHRREAWLVGRRRRRTGLRGITLYRGSQWIALNQKAARRVLEADPGLVDWFAKSWIPDEAFLQTVLHNDRELTVRNAKTTFVLDTPLRPTPGWMRLDLDDVPAVAASGAPFARKIDPVERPDVVLALDGLVERSRAVSRMDTRRSPG
jgi:hypothetical protein